MEPTSLADAATQSAQQLWPTIQSPLWLWMLLPALAAMVLLFLFAEKSRKRALSTFAAQRLLGGLLDSLSPARRTFKMVLLFAAIALLFIAAARPQYGYRWSETRSRGIDIMFVLDASRSMLATDIKPDRLQRAKLAILDFVEKLDGDRVGLVAFAGDAFVQCPLTLDYHAFDQSLEAVDTNVIPIGGTDFAKAVDIAEAAFEKGNNHKILVLITDGEDLEGAGLKRAKEAAAQGVTIYAVGVGTAEGSLIPLTDRYGRRSFVTDEAGNPVTTRLEAQTLTDIANATNGFYVPLGNAGQGLETVYEDGLQAIPRKELAARMQRHGIDRFQWPLALAVILLAWEPLISNRRGSRFRALLRARKSRKTSVKGTSVKNTNHKSIATLLVLGASITLLGLGTPQAQAVSLRRAESLYRKGDYEAAKTAFEQLLEKSPDSAQLRYNLANTLNALGDHAAAQDNYTQVLHSDDLKLQADAFYNLGISQYTTGENALAKATPAQILEASEQARNASVQATRNGERVLAEAARLKQQAEAQHTPNRPTNAQPPANEAAAQPEVPQQMVQQAIQAAEQAKDASESALKGNQALAAEAQNATQAWQRAQASFRSAESLSVNAEDALHNIGQTEKSIDALRTRIYSDEQANAAHRANVQSLEQLIEELKKLLKEPPQNDQQQQQDNQNNEQNQDQNQQDQSDQQNQDNQQGQNQDQQQSQSGQQNNPQIGSDSQQNQQNSGQQNQQQSGSKSDQQQSEGQQNQDQQQSAENPEHNKSDNADSQDSNQQRSDNGQDQQQGQNQQQNEPQNQTQNGQQNPDGQPSDEPQGQPQERPQQPAGGNNQQQGSRNNPADEQAAGGDSSKEPVSLTQEQIDQLAAGEQQTESGEAGVPATQGTGAMSRQEAAGLLESLRRSGKILPLSGHGQRPQTTRPQRDW